MKLNITNENTLNNKSFLKMRKSRDVNKLKYLLKIKIPRRRNFNTVASSHSISFAKNKVSCDVINI